MKSNIYKRVYNYEALKNFQMRVRFHNLTKKAPVEKSKDVIKNEKFKHEQNKRASQKRGLPKFDMDQANKLLSGKFHEDEDEEDDIDFKPATNAPINFQQHDEGTKEMHHAQESSNNSIVAALHNIFEQNADKGKNYEVDEIPEAIRKKYGLPKSMGLYELDFDKIR